MATIEYHVVEVATGDYSSATIAKAEKLGEICRAELEKIDRKDRNDRTLILVNNDKVCRFLAVYLFPKNLEVALITSNMLEEDENLMEKELEKWQDGTIPHLLCNIAMCDDGRIPVVNHTIFFDIPENTEEYVTFATELNEGMKRFVVKGQVTTLVGENASEEVKSVVQKLSEKIAKAASQREGGGEPAIYGPESDEDEVDVFGTEPKPQEPETSNGVSHVSNGNTVTVDGKTYTTITYKNKVYKVIPPGCSDDEDHFFVDGPSSEDEYDYPDNYVDHFQDGAPNDDTDSES